MAAPGPRMDAYSIRMRNLHRRYDLSDNAMQLFTALDEHRRGTRDPDDLRRRLQMSPRMRQTCMDAISSLAGAMRERPTLDRVSECTRLITCFSDMLTISNQPRRRKMSFPFMRLPPEVRQLVYKFYLRGLLTSDQPGSAVVIPGGSSMRGPGPSTSPGCYCPPHEGRRTGTAPRFDIPLCRVSGAIRDEVSAVWFGSEVFYFACCCELRDYLRDHASLRSNIRNIKVHWTGNVANDAFKRLKDVRRLKNLTIVISKSTTDYSSEWDRMLSPYFPKRGPPRLCDARGIHELLELRGLDHVEVEHVARVQAYRRANEDRHCLELLLRHYITTRDA